MTLALEPWGFTQMLGFLSSCGHLLWKVAFRAEISDLVPQTKNVEAKWWALSFHRLWV